MGIRGTWAACVLALAWCGGVQAAVDAGTAYEQVQARKRDAYREALARFDAAQAQAPRDAELAVSRCQFIAYYTDADADYIEQAERDFDACEAGLEARWPKAPEVALYRLANARGEEMAEQGRALLEVAKDWPKHMRARLYFDLAQEPDAPLAGQYALEALRLGDARDVGQAIEYLAKQGDYAEAERVLRDVPVHRSTWVADRRIRAATALPDPQVVVRELARHRKADVDVSPQVVARAWLKAGRVQEAQRALAGQAHVPGDLKFDLAMAARDWRAAAATIEMTDGDIVTPMKRFARLAAAAPSALLQPNMVVVLLVLAILSVVIALVPGVMLIPVHYRGLARRLGHRRPESPLPRVTLLHAWYGAAVAIVVPTLVQLVIAPDTIDGDADGAATLRMMLWASMLSLVALLPMLGAFGRRGLLGDRAMWRATWRAILGYWLLLVLISGASTLFFALLQQDTSTEQVRMIAAIADQASDASGVMLVLAGAALLGPLVEELVFRGLLLNGLSRHISFRWANGLQAFLFACMHLDPPRFLFYFAMGLFGGWLVRRTGSLAPAFALHALNNAWAMGVLMAT